MIRILSAVHYDNYSIRFIHDPTHPDIIFTVKGLKQNYFVLGFAPCIHKMTTASFNSKRRMATHVSLIKLDSAFIMDYNITTSLDLTVTAFAKNLSVIKIMSTKYIRGEELGQGFRAALAHSYP